MSTPFDTSKISEFWKDKESIRQRNALLMAILPDITKRAYRCYWDNGKTEKAFGNQYDATLDTIFLALNKWNQFDNLTDYLTHVFGYLKFYGHNARKNQDFEIGCDPIKLEWFALKFNRILTEKKTILVMSSNFIQFCNVCPIWNLRLLACIWLISGVTKK